MISNVFGIDEGHIIETIRLGGSRPTKPRLILAKSLWDTEDWKNISPDLTPNEKEEGRTLREALKERRLNGEVCIGVRRNTIVKITNYTQQTEIQQNNGKPYQDNSATESTSRRLE